MQRERERERETEIEMKISATIQYVHVVLRLSFEEIGPLRNNPQHPTGPPQVFLCPQENGAKSEGLVIWRSIFALADLYTAPGKLFYVSHKGPQEPIWPIRAHGHGPQGLGVVRLESAAQAD